MPSDEHTTPQTVTDADARFTEWMQLNLHRAADHFGLKPVFGWRLRTIGARATGSDGDRWLRVVTEFPEWAHGDTWTGNTDAGALTGITKPRVVGVYEWDEQNWRHQRAEVATLLPGGAVSPTNQLTATGQPIRHLVGSAALRHRRAARHPHIAHLHHRRAGGEAHP